MRLGNLRVPVCFLAAAASCATLAAAAPNNDPQQAYQQLFGDEEKAVSGTFAKADDVAFARKLLEAANGTTDSPNLRALLYDKAHEFGLKSKEGYPTAIEAARRLAEAFPQRKGDCDDKVLKVLELQCRFATRSEQPIIGRELLDHLTSLADADLAAGRYGEAVTHFRRAIALAQQIKAPQAQADVLVERLKSATAQEKVEADIASAQKAMAASPKSEPAARRLMLLYLIERDDPNKAGELMEAAGPDEQLRTFLPLLKQEFRTLPEGSCLELGGWYNSLAARATAYGKPKMLLRARGFYERYLDLHGKSDASALQAKLQLDRVTKELERCGGVPRAPGGATAKAGVSLVISDALMAWAKDRDAMAIPQQLEALQKKLGEVNCTEEELIASYSEKDGRITSLTFKETPALVSLTALVGMQLEQLKIKKSSVTDLSPLKGMKLLELDASGSPSLKDLSVVEGMPLRYLHLGGCPIVNLPSLKGMTLRTLGVKGCKYLTSFRGAEGAKIERIEADSAAIQDVQPLKGCDALSLVVPNCAALGSLKGIEGLPLTELNADGTAILNLEPIRGSKLTKLHVSQCVNLRDLAPIQSLPLTELYIAGAQITNLDALKGLPLRRLDLSKCVRVRSFAPLADMPLDDLNISELPIGSFEGLRGLKLTRLTAKDCPALTSLTGLDGMPLTSLTVSGCKALMNLKGLDGLPLTYLDLRGTRFTTVSVATDLRKRIPSLKTIEQLPS